MEGNFTYDRMENLHTLSYDAKVSRAFSKSLSADDEDDGSKRYSNKNSISSINRRSTFDMD